jgi:hypothetical protein
MSAPPMLMSFSEQYLVEENRVLRGQLKGHRLRLKDDQRRVSQ